MAHSPAAAERTLVVIPTFNEESHIEDCVRSLLGTGEMACTMVVCDGLSTDRTKEIVTRLQQEFSQLQWLDNPKRLQSAALNLAVEIFATPNTRHLVRCDAHSTYPDNFVIRVTQRLEATGAASVVTVMDSVGKACFEKANAWVVDTPLGSGGSAHRGGAVSQYIDHGHHAGFDIDWFRKVGGYDEAFSHNEDAEYDYRLGQAGGKIFLDAEIRIEYTPRGSLSAVARQYYNYGKGRARTTLKHGIRPKIRQMLPVFALIGVISGISLLPVLPWLALIPLSYFLLLVGVSVIVAVIKKSWCGILAGSALGAMHMSWAVGFIAGLVKFGIRPARRRKAAAR